MAERASLLGIPLRLSPINARRLANFRANARGFWSFWLFLVLFVLSLFAEFIANDRPLLVSYDGHLYAPVLHDYAETTFGGTFPTEADYRDPEVQEAHRGEGLDALAAHPLQLRDGGLRSAGARTLPADG